MSFSKQIDSLRKVDSSEVKRTYKDHVVYGNDIFALEAYRLLTEKYGSDNVLFLSSQDLTLEDLKTIGPSLLRGDNNIKIFKEFFPEIELEEMVGSPSFFKDGKFCRFGGRSKSEKLLEGEDFYTQRPYKLENEKVFSELFKNDLAQTLLTHSKKVMLKSIQKVSSEDLIERANFELNLANGEVIATENLTFCESPYYFYELFTDKKIFDEASLKFVDSTNSKAALYIRLTYPKPLTDKTSTRFIPQSYTHDWGHFIGEFKKVNNSEAQIAEFFTFVVREETSEEDISKKIRLLKKGIEKIYPESEKMKPLEFIKLSEKSWSHKIDDKGFEGFTNKLSNIKFVGENAGLAVNTHGVLNFEDSSIVISPLIRGLTSLRNL
jgi:hypothetical protein